MSVVHELKIESHYLDALVSGEKTFEVRFNDRGYQVGDILKLQDDHGWKSYRVTYIHSGLGMADGYVAMAVVREQA